MKKLIALLIAVNCFVNCKAQFNVYHKFPTDTCQWMVGFQEFGHPDYSTYSSYYLGDTSINNYTYNKILNYVYEYWGIYSFREDTLNRKIYAKALEAIYYPQDTNEYLLYDFGLAVGDSVLINWHNTYDLASTGTRYLHCTDIDSVMCEDGYHKRLKMEFFETPYWNFFNFQNYDYWVEGVGSSFGIFYFIPSAIGFWGDQFLYCFFLDTYPHNPIYGTYCYLYLEGISDSNGKGSLNVFPNPAKNGQPVYVKYNNSIKEVSLSDIGGRNIGQLQNVYGDTYTLPSEINTEGIYILSITDNLGNIFHQKIIIQP